jgi:predicted Zn-dependent peptidase
VIAVAGKFEEKETLARLEGSFGRRKSRRSGRGFSPYSVTKGRHTRARARLQQKETEQVQLAMAWPAYPYLHKNLAALNLLNIILGGNMSSRLFLNVREKRGLCYFIRSSVGPYQDVGSLSIQTGLAKDRLDEALQVITGELRKIRDKGVTKAELRRAKDFVRGKMSLAFEDSSKLADWFAKQELLTRKVETPDDKLRKLQAVTVDDVRRVARDVIRPARTTFAAIGPFVDPERFIKYADRLT